MSRLSIITAVRNGAPTISECLQSVRSQSFASEHLIIDGCSSDNTLSVIRAISPSAWVISEPDTGMYDAMNKGIALTTGEVVGILNADDCYANRHILAKVAKIFDETTADCCYGDLIYLREQSKVKTAKVNSLGDQTKNPTSSCHERRFHVARYWRSGPFCPEKFYWGWMPPHPTFFVRRRVYEQYGLFNLHLGSAADYELMLRYLLKHRITTVYLPEVLVHMRLGGVSNSSLKNRLKAHQMDRRAWEVNGINPHPWTLWCKPLRKIPQYLCGRISWERDSQLVARDPH